jgi:hypothetical protein
MGRANVKYGEKWACLSSIVDALITPFMSIDDYEEWRKKEYGIHCTPIKERNTMTIQDAVHTMRMQRGYDGVLKILVDCGVPEAEAKKLIEDEEDAHYKPKLIDGNYVCPNCGQVIQQYQKQCHNESCELKFVWRYVVEE